MQAALLVFFGAGLGGTLRHGVNLAALRLGAGAFPYGTLFINVAGSFAMGLLAGWFAARGEFASQPIRLFLMTGVLGGFTTFSAFSIESLVLLQRGAYATALAHTLAHVLGALACAALGWALGQVAFAAR